jgi:hypothetical protein
VLVVPQASTGFPVMFAVESHCAVGGQIPSFSAGM